MIDYTRPAPGRKWVKLDQGQLPPVNIRTIFTDGACSGPQSPGGWGWWMNIDTWAAGGFAATTNNIAELTAIYDALNSAPKEKPLAIISDSEYAVNTISVGARNWSENNWRLADGALPKNLDLVIKTHSLLESRNEITYLKRVRGHGKDKSMLPEHVIGNDHADRLAVEAKNLAANGDVRVRYSAGSIT